MRFEDDVTVIKAPNGWGKSGILKSLYESFGAEPHSVDHFWKDAKIASAVDFTIDDAAYTIVRFLGQYGVFDSERRLLLRTSSVSDGLAPFLARLTDFGLRMADRKEKVVIPPPAYIFAPYYIDQDKSWTTSWQPFLKIYLPNSTRTLIEYHSGIKPNEYYALMAKRELLIAQSKGAEDQASALTSALHHILAQGDELPVHLRLNDFIAETTSLVAKSQELVAAQGRFRSKLSELVEIRALWDAQLAVTAAALAETDAAFRGAVAHPRDVECPTCGAHYENDISARFHIAADSGALLTVVREAEAEIAELDRKIELQNVDIEAIRSAHEKVQSLLSFRRDDASLEDILRSEGRQQAANALRTQIDQLKKTIGDIALQTKSVARDLRALIDAKRTQMIKDHFRSQLTEAAGRLDVRVPSLLTMNKTSYARGSEGPRGIVAYFYSFLRTVRSYGSSVFCPIVIDAPNQQGQDAEHLPEILSYLLSQRPDGAQLILGVENVFEVHAEPRSFRNVGVKKRQLLSENEFKEVADLMRPLLSQLVDALD